MQKIFSFMLFIKAMREKFKGTECYKLRLLHPAGLLFFILFIITVPFICMFTSESIQDAYQATKEDTVLW